MTGDLRRLQRHIWIAWLLIVASPVSCKRPWPRVYRYPPMKRPRFGSHRVVIVLLLALLAFGLAVEGSQPTHSHEDGRVGLYNAECPLAELAAVHPAGWAPEPFTIALPAQAVLAVAVSSSGWAPSPSLSLSDSRAPPLV
jgi:hypothetical protein